MYKLSLLFSHTFTFNLLWITCVYCLAIFGYNLYERELSQETPFIILDVLWITCKPQIVLSYLLLLNISRWGTQNPKDGCRRVFWLLFFIYLFFIYLFFTILLRYFSFLFACLFVSICINMYLCYQINVMRSCILKWRESYNPRAIR
jgi:hypothetical protein